MIKSGVLRVLAVDELVDIGDRAPSPPFCLKKRKQSSTKAVQDVRVATRKRSQPPPCAVVEIDLAFLLNAYPKGFVSASSPVSSRTSNVSTAFAKSVETRINSTQVLETAKNKGDVYFPKHAFIELTSHIQERLALLNGTKAR